MIQGLMGVLLAGGESRRFGGNKALFQLSGRPMAAWALDALEAHFSSCVVVANDPAVAEALKIPGRPDRIPGQGPLGGLSTALAWAEEEAFEGVFLLACDLPLVSTELVGRILGAWPSHAPAAIPGSRGPLGMEPLCAGYRKGCLPLVEEVAASDRPTMMRALGSMGAYRVSPEVLGTDEELARAFTNVNTSRDAQRLEHLLPTCGHAEEALMKREGEGG